MRIFGITLTPAANSAGAPSGKKLEKSGSIESISQSKLHKTGKRHVSASYATTTAGAVGANDSSASLVDHRSTLKPVVAPLSRRTSLYNGMPSAAETDRDALTSPTQAAVAHKRTLTRTGSAHYVAESECLAYGRWITAELQEDPDTQRFMPLNSAQALFDACCDGVLLSKLLAKVAPGSLPLAGLKLHPTTVWEMTENHERFLRGCDRAGLKATNVRPMDMVGGLSDYLLLGIIWQIIELSL
ncbi:hypothetical protein CAUPRSCDRAFT_11788, partial [Caulochytrium protostelioides]